MNSLSGGNRVDAGDGRTMDREGRMDREAGVERGGETLEARRTRDSVQSDASGGLGQRPREGMGLFGDTVDQRQETRDVQERESNWLSPNWGSVLPQTLDCHERSLLPFHTTRQAIKQEPTAMPSFI